MERDVLGVRLHHRLVEVIHAAHLLHGLLRPGVRRGHLHADPVGRRGVEAPEGSDQRRVRGHRDAGRRRGLVPTSGRRSPRRTHALLPHHLFHVRHARRELRPGDRRRERHDRRDESRPGPRDHEPSSTRHHLGVLPAPPTPHTAFAGRTTTQSVAPITRSMRRGVPDVERGSSPAGRCGDGNGDRRHSGAAARRRTRAIGARRPRSPALRRQRRPCSSSRSVRTSARRSSGSRKSSP